MYLDAGRLGAAKALYSEVFGRSRQLPDDQRAELGDLKSKIHAVLTSTAAREEHLAEAGKVYRIQAGELDGKSGSRIVNAISEFLDQLSTQ